MGVGKRAGRPAWLAEVRAFGKADRHKAILQLIDTLGPYLALWAVMILAIRQGWSPWIVVGLAVVASALLIRTFIIFHDCCHGSFFASRRANRIWGTITGTLALTPYDDWRKDHVRHHGTAGDLDNRGTGDVQTMTVAEYRSATPWQRLSYRVYRHPLIMFGIGPFSSFVVGPRTAGKDADRPTRTGVWITNLGLLAFVAIGWATIGLLPYLALQIGIVWLAGVFGIWLFYVQHQFEGVYWARHDDWDPYRAAMEGSSHYDLPKLLQWISGNIGFHHIHHLSPTIPNYRLQACYDAIPEAREGKRLTLRTSLNCLGLALYDEDQGRLIRFRDLRA